MTTQSEMQPDPAWSKISGHSTLKPLSHATATETGVDRALIAERIYRYGWAYDERSLELLGDCFTEDGVWEGSVMGQVSVGPFEGRAAIVDFLTDFWTFQTDQRRHLFSNVIIDDLTDVSAVGHAYLQLTASTNASMTPVTTGPYRFEFVKQDDSWRMSRLSAGFDAPF
jgi:SnoaL-like domain